MNNYVYLFWGYNVFWGLIALYVVIFSLTYLARIGPFTAASSSAVGGGAPACAAWSCLTVQSTLAACSPPITLMRALGHIHS